MPIYEFQCSGCGIIFEELVRMGSDGTGLSCPECGNQKIQKKMSSFYGKVNDGGSSRAVSGGCHCGGNCGRCSSGGGCQCGH
ncbi:MAG: zinc ribbon domain-containing protein [bacterium]